MTDAPVIHLGENSPEQVALKLYDKIEIAERNPPRKKDQILDLYAECLLAVRNPLGRAK
jgi:hypothetical protein